MDLLRLLDLVQDDVVDSLVARDDDTLLSLDDGDDVPLARNYVNFPHLVELHEVVHHVALVPWLDLQEDECLLLSLRRQYCSRGPGTVFKVSPKHRTMIEEFRGGRPYRQGRRPRGSERGRQVQGHRLQA